MGDGLWIVTAGIAVSAALLCACAAYTERQKRLRTEALADAHLRRFATYQTKMSGYMDEYSRRIDASISALHECQVANDTLQAAVREREQSIAGLLRAVNEANLRAAALAKALHSEYVYVCADKRMLGPFSRS